ncbi:MAG: NAD-dependent epimerase/dehydratase family protein [Chloroflexota bacterium]|nr:NAD-dependent epimerase/dehydratase family protein [Chloroflexota bacterium]
MTTLVTGASGHVGLTLIQQLLEKGHTVRALDRNRNPILETLPVEFVNADLRDVTSYEHAFKGVELVFHVAAYISIQMHEWPTLEAINVHGVRNVVNLCKQYGVRRLVHFSSIEALDINPIDKPINESNALVSADFAIPYPRSKAAGQRIVLQAIAEGLNAVILYPTGIIGPNDYLARASNQLLVPVANGEVPALPMLGYDFVDVRDVASGAIAAQEIAPAGSSYVLGNARFMLPEMAAKVAKLVGVRAPQTIPAWTMMISLPWMELNAALTGKPSMITRASLYPLRNSHTISHERATRELGYQPRSIDESLHDTIAWFHQIGKVKHPVKASYR